ncbi:MAG: LuxR C-terminal-related transcriptional regulator [Sporichthyaceae bacterium]
MTTGTFLDRGRDAFRRDAWATASDELTAAAQQSALGAHDLEWLATAAYLAGRDAESQAAWEQAHHAHVHAGDPASAARCGFWLSLALILRGDMARGGGWVARSQRLVDDGQLDCAERGLLLLPAGFATLFEGGAAASYEIFGQAAAIGERFGERDLIAIARSGQGQALIRLGDSAAGIGLLDEVMTAVAGGEVGPIATGLIYCAVVETCHEIFDLRRAHEWTVALNDWCAAQPELVPYRGQCLVHRSEMMMQSGAWPESMQEVRLACRRLSVPPGQPALGRAMYQLGELHRLRGEVTDAEVAYQQASECGHYPQPGMALLRLAQGRAEAACAAIRAALEQVTDRLSRAPLLVACVEIVLAADEPDADQTAQAAADELTSIAAEVGAPMLRAMAAHAHGAVRLSAGDDRAALEALREAGEVWRGLQARYDGARTRVLVGLARQALGDEDTARFELDGARAVLVELGATPDVERVDRLSRPAGLGAAGAGGLSPRELEVLRLVATGRTNRAIAAELVLSERTVARHVSNIFAKLGLSSRSAATAYAYEHDLV